MNNETLLYLASGNYQSKYEDLPYQKIILVDRAKNQNQLPENSKVEYWQMDVVEALEKLQKDKIGIDTVVIMNEGMHEGGASYTLFSDFIMGLLHAVVKGSFKLITSLDYYATLKLKKIILKMNWGFVINKEIKKRDYGYINPRIFNTSATEIDNENFGEVFSVARIHRKIAKKHENVEINLIHGSIWTDRDKLDAFAFDFSTQIETNSVSRTHEFAKAYCERLDSKFIDLTNISISDLLHIIQNDDSINFIGICPWRNHDYAGVVQQITAYQFNRPIKINFYHLNKDDFFALYTCSAEFFFQTYPRLFFELRKEKEKEKWYRLESLLNWNIGHLLIPLCEFIQNENKQRPNEEPNHFKNINLIDDELKINVNKPNPYLDTYMKATKKIIEQEIQFKKLKR